MTNTKKWKCYTCRIEVKSEPTNNSERKDNLQEEILKKIKYMKTKIEELASIKDEIRSLNVSVQFVADQYKAKKKANKLTQETIKKIKRTR